MNRRAETQGKFPEVMAVTLCVPTPRRDKKDQKGKVGLQRTRSIAIRHQG